jgi:hypothetical protein
MKKLFLGAMIGLSFLVAAGNLFAQVKDEEEVALVKVLALLPVVYDKLNTIDKAFGPLPSFTLSDGKIFTSMSRDSEHTSGYTGELDGYLWSISPDRAGLETRRDEDYYLFGKKDENGFKFDGPVPFTDFENVLVKLNRMKPTKVTPENE